MNENSYELYKIAKRIIERAESCSGNHSEEPLFKLWKEAIAFMDASNKGYAERYEKEKADAIV